VTLATEAANGTLNTSQESAANQEYQSILSEINNIGSTTTYNQNQVFTGSLTGVNIYTGDSSSNGASIDDLYFASLSSSSVGDAGGTVQQNSKGEFVDLSKDTVPGTLTTAAATGNAVTGGLTFTMTAADGTQTTYSTTSTSISNLISEINAKNIPGVTASFTTAAAAGSSSASIAAGDTGIELTNTNPNVTIALSALVDTTTAITPAALTQNSDATTTIGYQFATGGDTTANLKVTSLATETGAAAAETVLNNAISYVAAQDGYIGAQINTLNSISQVMSTQQENIVSAQNAIQATDYASATSNMSKYEILSQTGIAALAQANSVQQEVTKLLQ
jgi:flagellin